MLLAYSKIVSEFYDSTKIDISNLSHFDTANVEDMTYMFLNCRSLTSIDLSSLNTSNVLSMEGMFEGCEMLVELDVSGFDTSRVENMIRMFSTAGIEETYEDIFVSNLKSIKFGPQWDTSKVVAMDYMFWGDTGLTSIDLSAFNTSNVESMSGMFGQCSSLKNLDLSSFDTSKVTDFYGVFLECSSLTTLDVSSFDTSNADFMSFMFGYCSNLTSLDVSSWNTTNVESYSSMFAGCSSLATIDVSGFNTEISVDMSYMFSGCSSLTELDLSSFDTRGLGLASISGMFEYCKNLKTVYVSDMWKTDYISYSFGVFMGCENIVGGNGTTYDSEYVSGEYAVVDSVGHPGYLTYKPMSVPQIDLVTVPAYKPEAEMNVGDFVNRCYSVTLGREADAEGYNYWVDALKNGEKCGVQVGHGFIFSTEYLNKNTTNDQFVNDMYSMFFGREADEEGYNYWKGLLDAGADREEIFAGFANSVEFYNLCGRYGVVCGYYVNGISDEQQGGVNCFVARLYEVCLNRLPDQAGQAYWTKQLIDGETTGSSCAYGFAFSDEFVNRGTTDKQYVAYMYLAFFGREADISGFSSWVYKLSNGYSRNDVFDGFTGSSEFANLCASYGINV